MRYIVKCDTCKEAMRETDSLQESAAGGECSWCKKERMRKMGLSGHEGRYWSGRRP